MDCHSRAGSCLPMCLLYVHSHMRDMSSSVKVGPAPTSRPSFRPPCAGPDELGC